MQRAINHHVGDTHGRAMGLASASKVLRVCSPDVLSQNVGGHCSAPASIAQLMQVQGRHKSLDTP